MLRVAAERVEERNQEGSGDRRRSRASREVAFWISPMRGEVSMGVAAGSPAWRLPAW